VDVTKQIFNFLKPAHLKFLLTIAYLQILQKKNCLQNVNFRRKDLTMRVMVSLLIPFL
jgi:hypothetical protein